VATIVVNSGQRLLIVGESGTGKSTLVRAIAGLWPWGDGRIEIAADAKMIFLPQQPYVPLGTLRRAAAYPDASDSRSNEAITEALRSVGLEHLQHRLDEEAPWHQLLSGGEKQRLGFARVLLHDPDIVVMDEATSALDPKSQDVLMALLVRWPKMMTIVSIGHRPELESYHDRKIVLERRGDSTRLMSDVHLALQLTDYVVPGELSAWCLKARTNEGGRITGAGRRTEITGAMGDKSFIRTDVNQRLRVAAQVPRSPLSESSPCPP
jgi:vitamin B12/bleomycin/antimicrobial peptide transport system ATP-binding/permease protein